MRDAWLKYHYPRDFYAGFLSKGLSKVTKKRAIQKQDAAREARTAGLEIMPPDINESGPDWTVVDGGIRLGLEAVKNVGPAGARAIVEHRPYSGYEDLDARVPAARCNITAKSSLVMAGAFDRWGMRDEYTEEAIDERERDLLGMSLTSTYSLVQYADIIERRIWTEDQIEEALDGTRVIVAGEVTRVDEKTDKRGGLMAHVDLAYGPDTWRCTFFAGIYEAYAELLATRRPIMITGLKDTFNGRVSIRVQRPDKRDPGDQTEPDLPAVMDLQELADALADEAEELAADSAVPEALTADQLR